MEAAYESDVARPPGGVARQLHRPLDRLRARVREEHLRRRAREDLGLEAFGQLDLRAVVEISAGHVQEPPGLLLDGSHNTRMRVTGGDDGDARREVEKAVAVHIGHPAALAAIHHERVRAGEAGRHRLGVAGDPLGGPGAGERRLDQRSALSSHARGEYQGGQADGAGGFTLYYVGSPKAAKAPTLPSAEPDDLPALLRSSHPALEPPF